MTRESELKTIISEAQAELNGLPKVARMGVREFARATGISPTTAMRIRNNHPSTGLKNIKKALPFLDECPACGQKLRKDKP